VGPRAGLDMVSKRKIPISLRESNTVYKLPENKVMYWSGNFRMENVNRNRFSSFGDKTSRRTDRHILPVMRSIYAFCAENAQ
jgi:hypothetical protein